MNMKHAPHPRRALRGALLATLASGFIAAQAADVPGPNAAFDADASGWYWENWSAPGSAASWDAAQNSATAGGAAGSGSLKLANNFVAGPDYQQAVYTLPLAAPTDFNNTIGAISFDVKVDDASAPRPSGNFGFLEVILRQGSGWAWVGLPGVALNGTGWQRVTFQVPKEGVDAIRAITVKHGDSDFGGPITLNIDNISYLTAPDHSLISGFDNGVEGNPVPNWVWENWSVSASATYDSPDTLGRSTSGTLKLTHDFAEVPGGYQQSVLTYQLPGGEVKAAQDYSYINLDVRVDPASTPRAGGDYGYFEVFLRNGGGWTWVGTKNGAASGTRLIGNEWQRLSLKVDGTSGADNVHRITTKLGDNGLLGPVILNIDNITWTRNLAPPPPPTLSLAPAVSGLSLVATDTDAYGRHNFYTVDNPEDSTFFNFVGATEPVSYSITLDSFPSAATYAGFQAHVFLVPGFPGSERSPDWNQPTLIYFDIKATAAGGGTAVFRIKTDQPGNNTELYGAGDPHVTVASATILGKWTLTAVGGSVFTMAAPDGTVSDPIDIGAEALALFEGNMRVYFGVQPNGDANKGQSARVGAVEIKKGSTILVDDSFNGSEFDLSKWVVNAAAGGVSFVSPADAGYVLKWTLPDTGFTLKMATSLSPEDWTDLALPGVQVGVNREVQVPKSSLPVGSQAYFMLFKPAPPAP